MAEVLSNVSSPHDSPIHFPSTPLRHTPSPRPSLPSGRPAYQSHCIPQSYYQESMEDPSSSEDHTSDESSPPQLPADYCLRSPLLSTPPSSISLDLKASEEDDFFPSYNNAPSYNSLPTYNSAPLYNDVHSYNGSEYDRPNTVTNPPASPVGGDYYEASASSVSDTTGTEDSSVDSTNLRPVADDTAVREEPSRQVDYLSHDWQEEDIWSSWKHIVSRRRVYGERSRLENASWRTWAKSKYHLKTVSPETLNWLKDCDVTWLYGPLQENQHRGRHGSDTASTLLKSCSFVNKKPILKKRTISEVMLQNSISSSSLVKQAAAAVQAQRNSTDGRSSGPLPRRPRPVRAQSDFTGTGTPMLSGDTADLPNPFISNSTSGIESPEGGGKKHIRFDDKVEQCIAVDFEHGGEREDEGTSWQKDSDDSSDDELVMNIKTKKNSQLPLNHRNSFNQDSKGIAMLPSTKLKYHREEPDCPGHSDTMTGTIHESASQETLRPSRPSTNFLLADNDDDDDEADVAWEPSGVFGKLRKDSMAGSLLGHAPQMSDQDGSEDSQFRGMRRTPSGMFMPFDEEDDQGFASTGILGKMVDTVNTARDIAHVIWNVGWRK